MFKTRLIRNLVLATLLGNLLGDSDVFVYIRLFIPMGEHIARAFSIVNEAGAFLFYAGGFLAAYIYTRPIDRFLAGDTGPELVAAAKRRTLNFPIVATFFWAALWLAGGAFFYLGLTFTEGGMSRLIILHVSLAVVFGGTVTSAFVYFLLEWATRRWLVHRVFGLDPVSEVPGIYRLGVRSKMTVYYFAVVVMPLLIIGGSVYIGTLEAGENMLDAFSSMVLPLTLVLSAWGIMVGLAFAMLLSRNLTQPVLELMCAIDCVKKGHLDQPLVVVSTDEIGRVREGFNDMLRGLKERDFVKETFGRYVTKQVSEAVLNGRLNLGGETREVTVLLCDIRDFTSMSERMDPEEVVEFLNDYFSKMVDVVIESEGTLDKFIGDAFLAVYGAPLPVDDHPLRAARAAMRMREELQRFNEERATRGRPPVNIGISIHTGRVVAGNIGSDRRMEYTVIGDTVNLASRIEGLNRRFHTDCLISEDTFARVKESVRAEKMEPVPVKGKTGMVQVYRLDAVTA